MKKKVIGFILILTMILTLTACSKTVKAQGVNLYVVAKGVNTSKLDVKISGLFPEDTTPELKYLDEQMLEDLIEKENEAASTVDPDYASYSDEEPTQVMSVSLKKSSENFLEYVITGISEGSDELIINFVKDGYSYSKVIISISINEKNKISSCTLNIGESQEKYELTESLEATDNDSTSIEFTLFDETAAWTTLEYDKDLITVSGPTHDTENLVTTWLLTGKTEGLANLTLVNKELKRRVDVVCEVYEVVTEEYVAEETESSALPGVIEVSEETEEAEDFGTYYIRIVASEEGDYDPSLSQAELDSLNTRNLYIPDGAKVLAYDEFEQSDGTPVVEMNMEFEGVTMSVRAESGNLSDLKKVLVDDSLGEKSEFVAGDITVECYEGNIDIYLFERNGVVYNIVIFGDPSYDTHKAIIEKYIG